ncbi:MAG: chemotaxis protein CheW [Burkholderiales bacterium]|nr:chemotaxis protein CheW [Burkholderiales bacterium]
MGFDMSQFYQVFFDEAAEHLESMESLLLQIDPAGAELEQLNAIFRAAHSIKGGAGTFGFTDMAELTHVAETLLDRLRRQELDIDADMIDALLQASDVLRSQLAGHQAGKPLESGDAKRLAARLQQLSTPPGAAVSVAPPEAVPVAVAPPALQMRRYRMRFAAPGEQVLIDNLIAELRALGTIAAQPPAATKGRGRKAARWEITVDTTADETELRNLLDFVLTPDALEFESLGPTPDADPAMSVAGIVDAMLDHDGYGFFEPLPEPEPDPGFGFFDDAPGMPVAVATADAITAEDPGFGFFDDAPGVPAAITTDPIAATAAVVAIAAAPHTANGADADKAKAAAGDSIRVSVEKVDQLINLVGELVITQSILVQASSHLDPALQEAVSHAMLQLERNSRDLQEAVMSIRMLPIAFVFSRYPRVVRDLANKLGKRVELRTVGDQTELDKGVIEKIADPLTHLVRNSLDHGLEKTEDRIAAGKPAVGTITLKAFHQGGNIVIEVLDDGRGLHRQKILDKARSRGLPVSDTMTDQEVFQLIFEPGFSTAEAVTDVSGRGVGMDVVRRNILQLGGRVDIDSRPGLGCTVSIRLPLTLAILDGMSVGVGKEMYIVPLMAVVESLQPRPEQIHTIAGSGMVLRLRDEFVPVLRLHEAMGLPPAERAFHEGIMVVVENDGMRAAMFVDELVGQHQVVIKNLESNYRRVRGISAATIMGDGRVAMILDVGALVRQVANMPMAA